MNAEPQPRVDLYALIHDGIRALLADLGAAAARLDLERIDQVDELTCRIERALGLLDQHAAHEDLHLMPLLRTLAPVVEAHLADDHRRLEALQSEVASAGYALAAAVPEERPVIAARLCQLLDALATGHIAHMDREETEANQALWMALGDAELISIRARIAGDLTATPATES